MNTDEVAKWNGTWSAPRYKCNDIVLALSVDSTDNLYANWVVPPVLAVNK